MRYTRYWPDGAGLAAAGGFAGPGVALPAAAAGAPVGLLKYLKNSELGDSTIRVSEDFRPA